MRWWRGYLPIAFAAVTLMIIAVGAITETYREWVAPGPLSLSHAQLLSNPQDPHRCASCHDDQFGAKSSLAEFSQKQVDAHSQTSRCIQCHVRQLPELVHRTPHDLPVASLQKLTQEAIARSGEQQKVDGKSWIPIGKMLRPVSKEENTTSCSDCHKEHQGSSHDLKAITSGRCQACHQQQFTSFAVGHPDFTNYPESASTQIAFDHARHRDMHFGKSSAVFECRSCHLDQSQQGRVGRVFRSLPFEVACASCHKAPLASSLQDGFVLFQVPSLNTTALKQQGVEISGWPEAASQYQEGVIPPLMLLLLAADPKNFDWIAKLPADGKLERLDLKRADDRMVIEKLANASKRLLFQIAQGGQSEVLKLLDVATKRPADSPVGTNSVGTNETTVRPNRDDVGRDLSMRNLPPDIARMAYQTWFGSNVDSNTPSRGEKLSWKPVKGAMHLSMGGWMIDTNRLAIVYLPTGHADDWLARILERLAYQIEAIKKEKGTESGTGVEQGILASEVSLFTNTGASKCTECHLILKERIDRLVTSSMVERDAPVRWRSAQFDPSIRNLTKFDHSPHLVLPAMQDCITCHRLPESQDKQPAIGAIQFSSVKKSDCVSCHHPNAAGDQCTQCHNYHANKTLLMKQNGLDRIVPGSVTAKAKGDVENR